MSAVWIENEVAPLEKDPKAGAKIEREIHKLEKRLCRQVGQAIMDFNMIEEGDRVMVCISGGKDSFGLLDILLSLKDRAPFGFEIIAVNLAPEEGRVHPMEPVKLAELGVKLAVEHAGGEHDHDDVMRHLLATMESLLRGDVASVSMRTSTSPVGDSSTMSSYTVYLAW